ncbi:MAG: recombinase family protein [Colwellia sp.]|nr:recombinase family protein [Colwellia sp.]
MANIGYIRVSSYSQKTDRQLVEIELDKVFEEKATAKDTNRPKLKACLEWLREGDILHVHSIDRLARNLSDLQKIVTDLTLKGVTTHFHKEHLLFSGHPDPLSKLTLQIIGAISEFELELINERRREGMAAAKLKGKQIGAKKKLTAEDIKDIEQKILAGESKVSLAKKAGVSRQTLYTALNSKKSNLS